MFDFAKMEWTQEFPKEIGVYWCKIETLAKGLLGKPDIRLCIIIRRDGEFWVCSNRPGEYGTPLRWFNKSFTQWCGPLNPQKEKRKAICPKCHFVLNSIDCCETWKDV